jgi:hypothetical protein
MKTYKTYQEAKIANPSPGCEIFVCKRKSAAYFETFKAIKNPETSHFCNGWEICKPADYCMTLGEFLSDGHELEDGDVFLNISNWVVEYIKITHYGVDGDAKRNDERYILRAKALEQKPSEDTGSKWNTGDECEIEMNGELGFYKFGCLVPDDRSMAIVFTDNGQMTIPTCRLSKPANTKESKQKPKRTKVEFVPIMKESVEAEMLDEVFIDDAGEVSIRDASVAEFLCKNLYRRIETEITERDEFIEQYYAALYAAFIKQKKVVNFGEYMADSGKVKFVGGE